MLEQSTTELQLTVNELEKRIDTPGVIDGESNSIFGISLCMQVMLDLKW